MGFSDLSTDTDSNDEDNEDKIDRLLNALEGMEDCFIPQSGNFELSATTTNTVAECILPLPPKPSDEIISVPNTEVIFERMCNANKCIEELKAQRRRSASENKPVHRKVGEINLCGSDADLSGNETIPSTSKRKVNINTRPDGFVDLTVSCKSDDDDTTVDKDSKQKNAPECTDTAIILAHIEEIKKQLMKKRKKKKRRKKYKRERSRRPRSGYTRSRSMSLSPDHLSINEYNPAANNNTGLLNTPLNQYGYGSVSPPGTRDGYGSVSPPGTRDYNSAISFPISPPRIRDSISPFAARTSAEREHYSRSRQPRSRDRSSYRESIRNGSRSRDRNCYRERARSGSHPQYVRSRSRSRCARDRSRRSRRERSRRSRIRSSSSPRENSRSKRSSRREKEEIQKIDWKKSSSRSLDKIREELRHKNEEAVKIIIDNDIAKKKQEKSSMRNAPENMQICTIDNTTAVTGKEEDFELNRLPFRPPHHSQSGYSKVSQLFKVTNGFR